MGREPGAPKPEAGLFFRLATERPSSQEISSKDTQTSPVIVHEPGKVEILSARSGGLPVCPTSEPFMVPMLVGSGFGGFA